MSNHERFLEPNFLISTHDNAVGRKQRKKRRRNLRGRERVFAKVGLRKDHVERINVDPSTILVPAALPKEIEEQMEPAPYAFSSMLTYSQRKKNAIPMQNGNRLVAQDLYSATRETFASPATKTHGQEDNIADFEENEDDYTPGESTMSNRRGDSLQELSTLSSFPSFSDTASHGMGIASRAMKQVATGANSSFGREERFAAESRIRRKIRTDRFYNLNCGTKCSLAKSVSTSLYGTAMAHSQAPRFLQKSPQLSQPDTIGPGSYKTSFGLISTKIRDRWDVQSSCFKSVHRNRSNLIGREPGRRGNRSSDKEGINGSALDNRKKNVHTQSAPMLESGIYSGASPFSKSSRSRAEEIMRQKKYAGQHNRRQLDRSKIGGNGSMTVVGKRSFNRQTPEERLSQTSWDDSKAWLTSEKAESQIPDNGIMDAVGKTSTVSPQLSTASNIDDSTFHNVPQILQTGGSSTIVTPQASIISVNEYMADKF
jgi:hypothetical protein